MLVQDLDGEDISASPAQIRAARALLGWSQIETAQLCGIGRSTLARIERQESAPRDDTYRRLLLVLRKNGVLFHRDDKVVGVSKILAQSPD